MRSAVDADIASLPCIERCSVTRYGLRHQRPAVDPDLRGAHDGQRDQVGHRAAAGQAAQPPYSVTPDSSRMSGSTSRASLRSDSCQPRRSEEHTSELQSLMRISSAVFCLKKKKSNTHK